MLTNLVAVFTAFRLAAASRRDLLFEIAAFANSSRFCAEVEPNHASNAPTGDSGSGSTGTGPGGAVPWSSSSQTPSYAGIAPGTEPTGDGAHEGSPVARVSPDATSNFIKRISAENPSWGEDRIALEMKLELGVEHAASTIRRYMIDSGPVPNSTWRAFLTNQAPDIYAFDLTTQVMWDFSLCYVLVVLELRTRRVVHINVTRSPHLDWVKQQIRDACPWEGPKFLIHDNDGIFGQFRTSRPHRSALDAWLSQVMGIRGVPIPYGAPNANAHCERVIGTLKRECLNHFIFRSEGHLRRTASEFKNDYNQARPHQGIAGIPAELDSPRKPPRDDANAHLIGVPVLGGLHHDYRLAA